MAPRYRAVTQAACYSCCLICVWMTMSALDGTELVGGRITGHLLQLGDAGLLLFILSLLLMRWLPMVSAASAVAASLLVSPLFLYLVTPGPFRHVFRGEWAVHLNSSFVWNTWAVFGIVAALAALFASVRYFYAMRHHDYSQ